jgi:hypothetical protein
MGKKLTIDRNVFNALHWGSNERDQGIVIASEEFPDELRYVVRKNELLIMGGGSGAFCLDLDAGQRFADEVKAIARCYDQCQGDFGPKMHLGGAEFFELIQGKKSQM